MGPRGEKKKKKDALKKVTRETLHSPENSPKAKTTRFGHEGKASRLDLSLTDSLMVSLKVVNLTCNSRGAECCFSWKRIVLKTPLEKQNLFLERDEVWNSRERNKRDREELK